MLGFFGTEAQPNIGIAKPHWPMRRIWTWTLGVLAGFHLLFVLHLKCTVDRAYALCSLAETALRENRLQSTERSFAPFDFTGWQRHRHFIAHEGATDPALDGFYGYTIPGAVEIGSGYSRPLHIFRRFQHVPPSDRHNLILSGRYRFVWFFHAEHFLLRFKTEKESPPARPLRAHDYHRERFPLNDAEWRALIEAHEEKPGV